jgi:predicted ABC-type ATPase
VNPAGGDSAILDDCRCKRLRQDDVTSKVEFRSILGVTEILDPDAVTREILIRHPEFERDRANREAADEIERRVASAISERQSFAVETVLSTMKYLPYLRRARATGYVVSMVYVAVRTADIAVERVAFREKFGGHGVPEDKVRSRWVRSHAVLNAFTPSLDSLFVFDNTEESAVLVARKVDGLVRILSPGRLPKVDEALEPRRGRAR